MPALNALKDAGKFPKEAVAGVATGVQTGTTSISRRHMGDAFIGRSSCVGRSLEWSSI